MNRKKTLKWLTKRNIELEEGFVPALRRYIEAYKKDHNIPRMNEVYHLLGTSRQNVAFWEENPCSTHTKNFEISSCT
ncbi:MAG: hypothetical protein HDT30_13665 [Clostridiales bacterium]|nr:hypothetical protein [Clostridiales bacterium]